MRALSLERRAELASLYVQLGRLIEQAPAIDMGTYGTPEVLLWLGRVQSIVERTGRTMDQLELANAKRRLGTALHDEAALFAPLYSTLAALEQFATASGSAVFLAAGAPFDTYQAVVKIVTQATSGIYIVDRYLDGSILGKYLIELRAGIPIRLLTTQNRFTESLIQATAPWREQLPDRAVEVRIVDKSLVHDRLIIIDGKDAWSCTQSFKDLATSAPAELINAAATTAEKIEAYEAIWATASAVAMP